MTDISANILTKTFTQLDQDFCLPEITPKDRLLRYKWAEYLALSHLEKGGLQDGRFSVFIEKNNFECLFQRKDSPFLFVLLSGARNEKRWDLPRFDRWTWTSDFPGSVLYVSDPALYLAPNSLKIGWYVGTAWRDMLGQLAKLVRVVANKIGVSSDRIISWGSSAGGFGALRLAAALKTGTALAVNPQTNILKYRPHHVNKYLEVCFNKRAPEQLKPQELRRFSAIECLAGEPLARCLVVQNTTDLFHLERHYTPFCEAFGLDPGQASNTAGRIRTMLYTKEGGHAPESRDMLPGLIKAVQDLNAANLDA